MNPISIIRSDGPILGDLDAVRHKWRWVLASGIAFIGLGSMAFGYSVLVTLASVFRPQALKDARPCSRA
jgi:uncharacterized membrane protein HdeD (DUF308 family)